MHNCHPSGGLKQEFISQFPTSTGSNEDSAAAKEGTGKGIFPTFAVDELR
jgi:hypothetical protein